MRLRCCVEWAQSPEKQSACSSSRTESGLRAAGSRCCKRADLLLDAQHFLHMMPELVRNHVCLREFARARRNGLAQLLEEVEVDVDLFILGAVERPGGRLRRPAAGLRVVAEEHELRMTVVVELSAPRSSAHRRGQTRRIAPGDLSPASRSASPETGRVAGAGDATRKDAEQVLLEDKAEHHQNEHAADTQMGAAEAASTEI